MWDIDVTEARRRQEDGWVYVDVRTVGEFAAGHPTGAVNVPVAFPGMFGAQPNPEFLTVLQRLFPPDTPLLLGCKTGARSAYACDVLAQAGYTRLANVAGGILAWDAAALPTGTDGRTWDQVRAG
jgi:rhodanese-related sulfurtransferase